MDLATARHLSELTTDFYRRVGPSFAATRQSPWPGWERVLRACGLAPGDALDVLDVACGNLRFERFLSRSGLTARVWAFDSCDGLAQMGAQSLAGMTYRHLDVVGALFEGEGPIGLEAPRCDLSVSFGFMHHVPLATQRARLLASLADRMRPGGHIAVSLWQFARNERLRARAVPVPGGDEGDYLLGWQGRKDVARYCHSFSEDEVDALSRCCGPAIREVARFSADGRTGDLNRYLVLQKADRPEG